MQNKNENKSAKTLNFKVVFSPLKKKQWYKKIGIKIDFAATKNLINFPIFILLLLLLEYLHDKYLKKKNLVEKSRGKTLHKFPQLNENLYNFYSLLFACAKSNISISENPLENLSLFFMYTVSLCYNKIEHFCCLPIYNNNLC